MNILTAVKVYIDSLEANCQARLAESVRVTVSYESANRLGTIAFDVPMLTAQRLHIGQRLDIDIAVADS